MANISQLLRDRAQVYRRGRESLRDGEIFYFTFLETAAGRCQFCWIAPAAGTAIVELWGASGSGGRMCCCSQVGIPGNPGAYSKRTIDVTGISYVCGWVGCAPEPNTLCYAGRSQCSVACIFNSSCNSTLSATGGFGGYTQCTTSTAQFFCLRCVTPFCSTDQSAGAGCGVVCNIGGPNAATEATASGGEVNLNGGFSCTRFWCNLNCAITSGPDQTLAISPGIYSFNSPSCVTFTRNATPTNMGAGGSTGRAESNIAVASFAGVMPQSYQCWRGNRPCGCYEFSGCNYGGVGIPGTSGWPCADVRSMGNRGGFGGVRISFYRAQ